MSAFRKMISGSSRRAPGPAPAPAPASASASTPVKSRSEAYDEFCGLTYKGIAVGTSYGAKVVQPAEMSMCLRSRWEDDHAPDGFVQLFPIDGHTGSDGERDHFTLQNPTDRLMFVALNRRQKSDPPRDCHDYRLRYSIHKAAEPGELPLKLADGTITLYVPHRLYSPKAYERKQPTSLASILAQLPDHVHDVRLCIGPDLEGHHPSAVFRQGAEVLLTALGPFPDGHKQEHLGDTGQFGDPIKVVVPPCRLSLEARAEFAIKPHKQAGHFTEVLRIHLSQRRADHIETNSNMDWAVLGEAHVDTRYKTWTHDVLLAHVRRQLAHHIQYLANHDRRISVLTWTRGSHAQTETGQTETGKMKERKHLELWDHIRQPVDRHRPGDYGKLVRLFGDHEKLAHGIPPPANRNWEREDFNQNPGLVLLQPFVEASRGGFKPWTATMPGFSPADFETFTGSDHLNFFKGMVEIISPHDHHETGNTPGSAMTLPYLYVTPGHYKEAQFERLADRFPFIRHWWTDLKQEWMFSRPQVSTTHWNGQKTVHLLLPLDPRNDAPTPAGTVSAFFDSLGVPTVRNSMSLPHGTQGDSNKHAALKPPSFCFLPEVLNPHHPGSEDRLALDHARRHVEIPHAHFTEIFQAGRREGGKSREMKRYARINPFFFDELPVSIRHDFEKLVNVIDKVVAPATLHIFAETKTIGSGYNDGGSVLWS